MKNFHKFLLLLTMAVVYGGLSSPIEWDYLQMSGGDDFSPNVYRIGFSPYLVLHKTDIGTGNAISITADNGTYMEFGSIVITAMAGDVISESIFNGMDSYFYHGPVSNDGNDIAQTDYPLIMERGDSVFLAFGTTLIDDIGNYYYGWMELGLAENGVLELHHSALDLDGGSMIVGGGACPTPEPSVGLLFALGAAVLGLRRRRFVSKPPPRLRLTCLSPHRRRASAPQGAGGRFP